MVDMAAKKKAREERLQAKRDMIQSEQGLAADQAAETEATEPEVKGEGK